MSARTPQVTIATAVDEEGGAVAVLGRAATAAGAEKGDRHVVVTHRAPCPVQAAREGVWSEA